MPDSPFDQELEQLLAYPEEPQNQAFVAEVMQSVKREQHSRKVILWVFGLVGALFGLAGAIMLSDSITRLFTFSLSLPIMETMQAVLVIVAVAAFYTWFMNDDLSLGN